MILEEDRITVGVATCGLSAGAGPVLEALQKADLGIPVMKVGCIGMCYNEPIVTLIRKGVKEIYGNITKDNVDELIECIRKWKRYDKCFLTNAIEELEFYKKQKRIVMENCGLVDPYSLEHYKHQGGYKGLIKAIEMKPKEVIQQVSDAKLRGRGGAGFPTGKKWSFIADAPKPKYLICNGDEGDPGAFMNRALMESDPYRIIEGMTIGAYATGCEQGIIYTRAEYPLAIKMLQNAIDNCYKSNLLGKNILGKGFNFDIKIRMGAGAFVCGEETALLNSIEGRRGQPRPRPPYPAVKGLYGKPTSVNNVGTWAHVATIMKIGVAKYTRLGTDKTKGTKIICLTGHVQRTGVIEVPFGIKLKEIVFDVGGGTSQGTEFKAILSGGPGGGIIPEKHINTRLDYETMGALGTIMGSGAFIILDNKSCVVNIARYFMKFIQEESCGKCTPCREGTKRLLEMLTDVTRGSADEKKLLLIEELAEFVRDNSLCGLGQNAPNPVLSTLKHFKEEYILHIKEHKCIAGVCENMLTFTIDKSKCKKCDACRRACPVGAITGSKDEDYMIHQEKCIKCGKCFEACNFGAVQRK